MNPSRNILHSRYNLGAIFRAGVSVGEDVWNPEGGLNVETPDSEILEVVFDVAKGQPYGAAVNDEPTEAMRQMALTGFWKGVGDATVR